jgi:hypothetical protein
MKDYDIGGMVSRVCTPKKHATDYPSNFLDYLIPFYSGQKPRTEAHKYEAPPPSISTLKKG